MRFLINSITVSRLLLSISVLAFHSDIYLLGVSLWCAFSDFLDGSLARRLKLSSSTGERLDQLADKVFHLTMLFYLLFVHLAPLYFVVLFVLRELAIVVLRYTGRSSSSSVGVGKWKTTLCYCYIIYLFTMWYLYKEDSLIFVSRALEVVILLLSYWSLIISLKRSHAKG
jgi:cardiolipin synthase (CMP-forming)